MTLEQRSKVVYWVSFNCKIRDGPWICLIYQQSTIIWLEPDKCSQLLPFCHRCSLVIHEQSGDTMAHKSSFSDGRSLLTSEAENIGPSNYGATALSEAELPLIHQQPNTEPPHLEGERSLSKKGIRNMKQKNVRCTDKAFWKDIFTTFLDARWRWLILTVCIVYFSSWLIFGAIWYTILYVHGDFQAENLGNPEWRPCVTNMQDYTSTFLFSLETQQTTGYGYYHITEKCASAVITLCVQSIIGVILEGLVVGLVLLKLSRAKKRTATLLFSRNAVISKRDGHLCLMFRVADLRTKSTLLQATIRAQVITSRVTLEGEEVPISQEELEVGGEGERGNNLLLLWPTTVIHRINDASPLFKFMDVETWDATCPHFEIIVVLEGVVEATGLVTQARTSYLRSEILLGHRFRNLKKVRDHSKTGGPETHSTYIDYSNFHDTHEVAIPRVTEVKDWSY